MFKHIIFASLCTSALPSLAAEKPALTETEMRDLVEKEDAEAKARGGRLVHDVTKPADAARFFDQIVFYRARSDHFTGGQHGYPIHPPHYFRFGYIRGGTVPSLQILLRVVAGETPGAVATGSRALDASSIATHEQTLGCIMIRELGGTEREDIREILKKRQAAFENMSLADSLALLKK